MQTSQEFVVTDNIHAMTFSNFYATSFPDAVG